MRLTTPPPLFAVVAATTLLASACNCGTPEIEGVPEEGPMPELRTGTLEPHALAPVRSEVLQRHIEPGTTALAGEYLALSGHPA